MAAPPVLARQASVSSTSDSNSFTPTLPTVTAGKLLLAVVSADGSPTLSTSSTGWLKMGQASNGANVTQAVFAKLKATGSDALVVASTANEQYSAETFCIDAGDIPGLNIGFANGNSTNSNPPSVTISPAQDVLWIATRSGDAQVVATVAPSGYSNLTSQAGGGANGASTNTAELAVSADTSEDPGTFTSATEQWVSATIAVWQDAASRFLQFNKPAGWTLSNNSLTSTQTALAGNTMLTTLPRNSGKWYWEWTVTQGDSISLCIAPHTANVNDYPDNSGGLNYSGSGAVYANSGTVVATIQTFSPGHVVAGCLDSATGDVWYKNLTTGSNWNNSGTADPVTGVGGINLPSLAGALVMPGLGGETGASAFTIATWNGAPSNSKPSGFNNWDYFAPASISGTASITEASDTCNAAGTLDITGTGSVNEAGDTCNAAGTVAITGTASITEDSDTCNATGEPGSLAGTASITEDSDTCSGAGTLTLSGTASINEDSDTCNGSATKENRGTASITEDSDTCSGAGVLAIIGTASIQEDSDTAAGAGVLPIGGMGSGIEDSDTCAGAGALAITGTASITEASDTCNGAGQGVSAPGTGSASIQEDSDTCSGVGTLTLSGAASINEASDTCNAAGALAITGTASINEASDTCAGTGESKLSGSASIQEDSDTAGGAGVLAIRATASIHEDSDTCRGAGGSGVLIIDPLRFVVARRRGVEMVVAVRDATAKSGVRQLGHIAGSGDGFARG